MTPAPAPSLTVAGRAPTGARPHSPKPRKGVPMTKSSRANRVKAIALVLAFLLPAFAALATPAAAVHATATPPAQPPAILAPWTPIEGTHDLYLRVTVPSGTATEPSAFHLHTGKPSAAFSTPPSLYQSYSPGTGQGAKVAFTSVELAHDITLSNFTNPALQINERPSIDVYVQVPSINGLRFKADLKQVKGSDQPSVAYNNDISNTGTRVNITALPNDPGRYRVTADLMVRPGKEVMDAGSKLVLELTAFSTLITEQPTSWTLLMDAREYPSHLGLPSRDALQISTWITNATGALTANNVLPVSERVKENALTAHMAVKSAFGRQESMNAPNVEVRWAVKHRASGTAIDLLHNQTDPAGLQTNLLMTAGTASTSDGYNVWTAPFHFGDDHVPAGDYRLEFVVAMMRNVGGSGEVRHNTHLDFTVTKVSFAFGLWPGEASGHTISNLTSGVKSTTFVLNLTNLGASQDVITLTRSGPHTAGWTVGGDLVQDRVTIDLHAKETRRILVTLTAPANANVGDASAQAALNITARGTFDTTPKVIPLAATLTQDAVRHDLGVILDRSSQTLSRLTEVATYDVLVWNKGNAPGNFTVALTPVTQGSSWTYTPTALTRVNNLGAGEIKAVTVEVRTPATLTIEETFSLRARAEIVATPGIGVIERVLSTAFKVTPTFDLKVFDPQTKEMRDSAKMTVRGGCVDASTSTVSAPQGADETDDHFYKRTCATDLRAPGWIVFPVWITNTGPVSSSYRLAVSPLAETDAQNRQVAQPTFYLPSTLPANYGKNPYQSYPSSVYTDITYPDSHIVPLDEKHNFGYYDDRGKWVRLVDDLLANVPAGATVETYVKIRQDNSTDLVRKVDFTVTATETSSPPSPSKERKVNLNIERVAGTHANTASLSYGFHAMLTQRAADYATSHIVRPVPEVQYVAPGGTTEFVFRVSNLANFVTGTADGQPIRNRSLNVSLVGTLPPGWDVQIRNISQKAGQPVDWKSGRDGIDFIPPANLPHPHVVGDATGAQYHHVFAAPWDTEYVIRVKAPAGAQVNVDQLPLQLRVRSMEAFSLGKPDWEKFYDLKTVVGAAVGLEFTPPTVVDVKPGIPNTYPITLKNTGSRTLDLLISKELTGQTGWTVSFSDALLVLRPGEKQTITATVQFATGTNANSNSIFFTACEGTSGNTQCPATNSLARKEVRHRIIERSAIVFSYDVLEQHLDLQNGVSVDPVRFRFNVTNDAATPLRVEFRVTPNMTDAEWARNWSIVLTPGNISSLQGKGRASVELVLAQGARAVAGSAYPFTVTAHAFFMDGRPLTPDKPSDLITFTATTRAGTPRPELLPDESERTVDRAGFVRFPVRIQNTGPVDGDFPLTVDLDNAPIGWRARIESEFGVNTPISNISVRSGQTRLFYVNISAPVDVPPGTVISATVNAYRTAGSAGFSSRSLTATVHDYAFDLQLPTSTVWIEPGKKHEFRFNVTNLGNGWDNISFIPSLPNEDNRTWLRTVDLGPTNKLTLKPGERKEVVINLEPPVGDNAGKRWVTPGARMFTVYAWSTDARLTQQVINVTEKASSTLQVYNFAHNDVDADGVEELAIDLDRDSTNGFEAFREMTGKGGKVSRVIQKFDAEADGKTAFILDTGRLDASDGRGDRYWNPDSGVLTNVTAVFSVGGKPVYLFDRSGLENLGGMLAEEVDTAYFSGVDATEQIRRAVRKNIVHADLREYVVFSAEDDQVPVLYFSLGNDLDDTSDDVQTEVSTATGQSGGALYGIRTDPYKNEVTHYFDVEADSIRGATSQNLLDFTKEFWYFFALFGLVVVVGVGVLVNRVRVKKE